MKCRTCLRELTDCPGLELGSKFCKHHTSPDVPTLDSMDEKLKQYHTHVLILRKELQEAYRVIAFYADSRNWLKQSKQRWTTIKDTDHEQFTARYLGGKLARNFLKR